MPNGRKKSWSVSGSSKKVRVRTGKGYGQGYTKGRKPSNRRFTATFPKHVQRRPSADLTLPPVGSTYYATDPGRSKKIRRSLRHWTPRHS